MVAQKHDDSPNVERRDIEMKAVLTMAPGNMEVTEMPRPIPGENQALIRVESVGLCGSDYHFYHGKHPYAVYPQIQGHEFCGIVENLPNNYDGPAKVGDRVAVEPLIPCGHCFPCRNHRPNCCTQLQVLGAHTTGALSEYIAVNATTVYPVGDLDAELAALVEPMSIGFHAVKRAEVAESDHVLVFGAGPIGQAVTLAATDRGAQVFAVDQIESRLQLISKLGAKRTLLASEEVSKAVEEWTNGDGPSIVFDATGVPSVIRSAVQLVAHSGKVVIIGLSTNEVSLPVIDFTRKELTILGSRNNAGVFGDTVELVKRNRHKVKELITHRFKLEETPQAMEYAVNNPQEVEKVIIRVQ